MQTSPALFPKTLLDIKVSPETVLDLYRNCGLPISLINKLLTDLPPNCLEELVDFTSYGLRVSHEGGFELSKLSFVLQGLLFHLLGKAVK